MFPSISGPSMNLSNSLLSFTLVGAEWVLYLLILLSILSVAVMIERAFVFVTTGSDLAALRQVLEAGIVQPPEKLREALSSHKGGEAQVLSRALERAAAGSASVEELFAGLIAFERARLERGIAFLGTVGSNAPFIGLFGTVLGIIKAFHDLSKHQGGGAEVVMSGISEALVATAVGLMVAIPAVMAYNFFQRRARQRLAQLTALSHLALACLKANAGRSHGGSA